MLPCLFPFESLRPRLTLSRGASSPRRGGSLEDVGIFTPRDHGDRLGDGPCEAPNLCGDSSNLGPPRVWAKDPDLPDHHGSRSFLRLYQEGLDEPVPFDPQNFLLLPVAFFIHLKSPGVGFPHQFCSS